MSILGYSFLMRSAGFLVLPWRGRPPGRMSFPASWWSWWWPGPVTVLPGVADCAPSDGGSGSARGGTGCRVGRRGAGVEARLGWGPAGPRTVPPCFSWGSWALRPVLAVKSCWSSTRKFHASVSVSHPGATGRRALCRTLELLGGQSSHSEGWAPLWAVPCVASRWRLRPVDRGASRGQPGKLELRSLVPGAGGAALGTSHGLKVLLPSSCPSHGGFFVLRSLWFLFWAHTLRSLTAQRVQREEEPFSFPSSPSPHFPAVPGVVVQRGPACRLCQASRSDVTSDARGRGPCARAWPSQSFPFRPARSPRTCSRVFLLFLNPLISWRSRAPRSSKPHPLLRTKASSGRCRGLIITVRRFHIHARGPVVQGTNHAQFQ